MCVSVHFIFYHLAQKAQIEIIYSQVTFCVYKRYICLNKVSSNLWSLFKDSLNLSQWEQCLWKQGLPGCFQSIRSSLFFPKFLSVQGSGTALLSSGSPFPWWSTCSYYSSCPFPTIMSFFCLFLVDFHLLSVHFYLFLTMISFSPCPSFFLWHRSWEQVMRGNCDGG